MLIRKKSGKLSYAPRMLLSLFYPFNFTSFVVYQNVFLFTPPISVICALNFRDSWPGATNFASFHWRLPIWKCNTIFSIVSIDNSFVKVSFWLTWVSPMAYWGLKMRRPFYITRFLVIFYELKLWNHSIIRSSTLNYSIIFSSALFAKRTVNNTR